MWVTALFKDRDSNKDDERDGADMHDEGNLFEFRV